MREFLVHCWWNGYDQIHTIVLAPGQKANTDTFIPIVRQRNDDDWDLATKIYSWSLIEE